MLLAAYQAELLADLEAQLCEGSSPVSLLAEIRAIQDFTLGALDGMTQSTGRTMALVVASERRIWLDLTATAEGGRGSSVSPPLEAETPSTERRWT